MPTYVYECSSCNSTFETEQRITESPLETCLSCNAKGTVKRVIQPVGVMFKGAGFHINDYSAKSAPAEAPAAAASEPAPAPAPAPAPTPTTE